MPDHSEKEARLWETLGRIEETLKKLTGSGDGESKKEPEKVPAPPEPPKEPEEPEKPEPPAQKARSFLDWLW